MKKTYITPAINLVELLTRAQMMSVSTDKEYADTGGGHGVGNEDQEGTGGLVKGDRDLWDEEW